QERGYCSLGLARPLSSILLFPSVLCLNVGLLLADLGALRPAPAPYTTGRVRASGFGLSRASRALGKTGSASFVAQHCALASRRALVPVCPAWASDSKFPGFPGGTRDLRGSCRSELAPSAGLPDRNGLLPHNWDRPVVGGNWVAWFRTTVSP